MVEKDVIVGRFVFDTSGVGGSGKYSKSSSGGSTGAVAGGMAVWDIIKGTLVKIFDIMKKSSGQLQGSLKIINTSLILFLRPIADVIGMILRPFALMMLKYGLQFYKWWNSNSTKFQNFLNVIGKPLGNIADLFKTIFSIPTNPVDIIFNPIVDQIAKTVAVDVATGLGNLWGAVKDFFYNKIWNTDLGNTIVDGIKYLFNGIKDFFYNAIWNAGDLGSLILDGLSSLWNAFKDWAMSKITGYKTSSETPTEYSGGSTQGMYGGSTSSNTSGGGGSSLYPSYIGTGGPRYDNSVSTGPPISGGGGFAWSNPITDIIGGIKNFFHMGQSHNDAFFSKNGNITPLSSDDNVYAFKGKGNMGGGHTINVNISALDASSISRETINKLTFEIERSLKKTFSGRTAEMFGA